MPRLRFVHAELGQPYRAQPAEGFDSVESAAKWIVARFESLEDEYERLFIDCELILAEDPPSTRTLEMSQLSRVFI